MTPPASITITPVRVADLLAEGERIPVYVHVIDHPDARVLVDTGITELHHPRVGRGARRAVRAGRRRARAASRAPTRPGAGHTRGMQVLVVETGGRPVVVGGDV